VKLLLLGGPRFLGRAIADAALERGHAITFFNRGRTNPDLYQGVERLVGDRASNLAALAGREWDAIVDTCGYLPKDVRASAEALADAVGLYCFVSSVSVYADFSRPVDEESTVAQLGELPDDEITEDTYGPLKALCEAAVREAFAERASIVRPGLIVGPHDPTGRFTYWPQRIARGGEVLAPAPPDEPTQFIDVRDLGDWIVSLCERRVGGTFNATHPGVSWGELLDSCLSVTGSDATISWIDRDFLVEQDVGQWVELPLWIHDPDATYFDRVDVTRALAAGLVFRPLAETVRATFVDARTTEAAGLTPEREGELLEAWRGRG
jgi:nucleoside-diphosphate-sugar epimerase